MKCSGLWLSPIASLLFVALISPPTVAAGDEPRTVETAAQSADTCGVTTAQERPFTAPAPYPPTAPSTGFFWFGGEELWTMLQVDGTWKGLPRNSQGLRQKVFWWHPGFDGRSEPTPDLEVSGRRLDGTESFVRRAPATNAHHPDFGGWAILTGIDVPTVGCWELTARYRGQILTFVVRVTA